MKNIIDEFTKHIILVRGLSKNTAQSYRSDIIEFLEFCNEKVEKHSVADFIYHLYSKGIAPSTINRKISAILSFLKFASQKDASYNIALHNIERPKGWQRLPSTLSEIEIKRLIDAPDTSTEEGLRDKAILELLYSSGLRVSELINIKIEDINFENQTIMLKTTKGNKQRIVPFGKDASLWLKKYLKNRKTDSQFLFTTRKGNKLTRQRVWQIIKKYSKKAGITKNIYPHTIRHSFATHILSKGANLRVIQELLGHSNITTTQIYTEIEDPELEELYRKIHPRS